MVLSSSPTFLTKVNGNSSICSVPSCEPTAKMFWLCSWNFMELIPMEPTEYCMVHLWDWSMKSQISIVPLDFPMKQTPALLGLQHPAVWKHPLVTMLLKRGTWVMVSLHQCCSSRCRNGSRRQSGWCFRLKAISPRQRPVGSIFLDSKNRLWCHFCCQLHLLILRTSHKQTVLLGL